MRSAPDLPALFELPSRPIPGANLPLRLVTAARLQPDAHPSLLVVADDTAWSVAVGPDGLPAGAHLALATAPVAWARRGDFDRNGLDDLALQLEGGPDLHLHFADGRGGFGPAVVTPLAAGSVLLEVADVDGDGLPDVTWQPPDEQRIEFLVGDGTGAFREQGGIPSGSLLSGPVFGDFDGDGTPDLALRLVSPIPLAPLLAWERGLGGGLFGPPQVLGPGGLPRLAGRFDGDPVDDLVTWVAQAGDTVRIYRGGPGGLTADDVLAPGLDAEALLEEDVDVDDDGLADLLLLQDGEQLAWSRQLAGGFAPPIPLGKVPWDHALADFDGDGAADLALVFSLGSSALPPTGAMLTVLRGHGDGTVDGLAGLPALAALRAVGDLTGDGRPDLVGFSDWDAFELQLRRGRVGGGFESAGPLPGLEGITGSPLAICDLDGDARDDLLFAQFTASPASGSVFAVATADGAGSFSLLPTPPVAGPAALDLQPADLDGDGLTDLFGTVISIDNGSMVLLHNSATPDFPGGGVLAYEPLPTPHESFGTKQLRLGDLDGDGDLDVLRLGGFDLDLSSPAWLVVHAMQDLLPAPEVGVTTFAQGGRFDVGDIDLDGDLDVVASGAGETGPVLRGLLNDGAGGLSLAWEASLDGTPGAIDDFPIGALDLKLADIEGDPTPELIVPGDAPLSVLRTYGLETGVPVQVGTGWLPGGLDRLRLLDANRDGHADLLAAALVTDGQVVELLSTAGPWTELGASLGGTAGASRLAAEGSLLPGTEVLLEVRGAAPGAFGWLVLGDAIADLPFKGGTLVPQPLVLLRGLLTNADGFCQLAGTWPGGVPGGQVLVLQGWFVDAGAPQGLSSTTALLATVP